MLLKLADLYVRTEALMRQAGLRSKSHRYQQCFVLAQPTHALLPLAHHDGIVAAQLPA